MTNPPPTIVYAVYNSDTDTDGGAIALFTTEALANEHATALNAGHTTGDYQVEPYMLCDHTPQKVIRHQVHGQVFHADGRVWQSDHRMIYNEWDYERVVDPQVNMNRLLKQTTITVIASSGELAEAAFAKTAHAIAEQILAKASS